MKRMRTCAVIGLVGLILFGCSAPAGEYGAETETDRIQIVGQIETPEPAAAPQEAVSAGSKAESRTEEPILMPEPIVNEREATPAPTPVPTEAPAPEPTAAATAKPTPAPTHIPRVETDAVGEPDTSKADAFCELAKTFLDTPYHRGGTSPETGFDPGGFVYYCLNQIGVKVRHKSSKGYSEYDSWQRVDSMDELEPGDLCFFMTPGNESVNCVCIYLGDGQMIYPSSGEGKVITSRIGTNYWKEAFVFARRVF